MPKIKVEELGHDPETGERLLHICGLSSFSRFSLEELRLKHYIEMYADNVL